MSMVATLLRSVLIKTLGRVMSLNKILQQSYHVCLRVSRIDTIAETPNVPIK